MEPNLPLRDIHLPDPISWWPLAPGWWLLLFGVPLLLALLFWIWRFIRRRTVKKLALAELDSIVHSTADAREKIQKLAILLRRVALSVYPREQVASLVGEEWLKFLDNALGKNSFSEGEGRLFIEAQYRPEVQADLDGLAALCREWISHLPKPGKASPTISKAEFKQRPVESDPEANQAAELEPLPIDRPSALDSKRFAKPPAGGGAPQ